MKKLRSVLGIVCLIVLPVLVESCCLGTGSCGCGSHKGGSSSFHIESMTMVATAAPAVYPYNPKNSGQMKDFAFVAETGIQVATTDSKHRGTMAAYACSPAPLMSLETFTAIKITSQMEISTNVQTLAAGENLTPFFLVKYNEQPKQVSEILNVQIEDFMRDWIFTFDTHQNVASTQMHNFVFDFTLSDGRTIQVLSGPVELVP